MSVQIAMQLSFDNYRCKISFEFSLVELAFWTILMKRLPAQLVDPPELVEILRNINKNLPHHLSLGLKPTHEIILYFYSMTTTQLEVKQGELLIALKVTLLQN